MSAYCRICALAFSANQLQAPSTGQASPAFWTNEFATRGALELISLMTEEILRIYLILSSSPSSET